MLYLTLNWSDILIQPAVQIHRSETCDECSCDLVQFVSWLEHLIQHGSSVLHPVSVPVYLISSTEIGKSNSVSKGLPGAEMIDNTKQKLLALH